MSRLIAALFLAVTWIAVSSSSWAEDAPKSKAAAKAERAVSLEEKLALPAEGQYLDTQMGDVVSDLQLRYGLPIVLDDETVLGADGLGRETPITLTLKNVSLASLLNHVLLRNGFDWMIRDEMLVITTAGTAAANEDTRVYSVADLAARKGFSYDSLSDVIQNSISPDMWRPNGGTSGQITSVPGLQALIVTAPSRRHREIARLLDVLRELKPDTAPSDSVGIPLGMEGKIRQELLEQTEFQYLDTQLGDIAADLELRHRISILIDKPALTADGRDEVILSAQLKNLSLASALNHMLRSRELTWVVADETLLLTTPSAATSPEKLQLRVYPIGDLVEFDPADGDLEPLSNLRNVLESSISPDQWADAGGFAGFDSFPSGKAIVIRHTEQGHRQVASLLTELRKTKKQTGAGAVKVEEPLTTKFYPIGDLAAENRARATDAGLLVETLRRTTLPNSWGNYDGSGKQPSIIVDPLTQSLVVVQTVKGHYAVAQFMSQVRHDLHGVKAGAGSGDSDRK